MWHPIFPVVKRLVVSTAMYLVTIVAVKSCSCDMNSYDSLLHNCKH